MPELAEALEADRNLTDGARRLARQLAAIIYRQNRQGRFTEITVNYLMTALQRSRRTIQRYLRLLERAGYIHTEVIRGERSRLCTGLLIALCTPLFARHHRKSWPGKAANPGAPKMSQNYKFKDSTKKKSASLRPALEPFVHGRRVQSLYENRSARTYENNPAPDSLILPISA